MMYNKFPIPADQAAIWPNLDRPTSSMPDGPLAVISSVLATARRHKLPFALWMLFCIGAAAIYAYTATPFYTATATLLLEPRRQAQAAPDSLMSPGFDVSRAESELQVLRSERLLANVFTSLNLADHPEFKPQPPGLLGSLRDAIGSVLVPLLSLTPATAPSRQTAQQMMFESFVQRFSVRRVGQSYVAEISYTSADPTLARRVANAAASAYLYQSIAAKADAAKNGAEFLQGRLNALSAQARAAAAGVTAGSLPDAPTPDADARIIGAALEPLKPSAPVKSLILALGAMVGLVGGFLGVALGQALDRRVRTPQDIAQRAGLPCLATLPEADGRARLLWRRSRDYPPILASRSMGSRFTKGIRELRAFIQLANSAKQGDGEAAIALVACGPRAGTSLICLHLARLIRDGGRPVTLIDADVHGTSIWPMTGQDARDTDSLADMLNDGSRIGKADFLDRGGIALIPAKSRNAEINKRAYLGSPAMQQVIERARRNGPVILDLPSLSAAAEARAVAKRADVVVIVAQAGQTTVDELIDAATGLRSVGANVIGVVLNRAAR